MGQVAKSVLTTFVVLLISIWIADRAVFAAEISQDDRQFSQQRFDKRMRDAQTAETIGYVLAGAGILLAIASIPVMIHQDRKKKARRAAQQASNTVRLSEPE